MYVEQGAGVAGVVDAVQIPVQLTSTMRRQLTQWCQETALLLDIPGIGGADLVAVLIDQLVNDPRTSEAVCRRLAEMPTYSTAPAASLPARTVAGARADQPLAHRPCQPPTNTLGAAVTRTGHHRRSAGRPARLGAVRDGCRDDESRLAETPAAMTPVDTLRA